MVRPTLSWIPKQIRGLVPGVISIQGLWHFFSRDGATCGLWPIPSNLDKSHTRWPCHSEHKIRIPHINFARPKSRFVTKIGADNFALMFIKIDYTSSLSCDNQIAFFNITRILMTHWKHNTDIHTSMLLCNLATYHKYHNHTRFKILRNLDQLDRHHNSAKETISVLLLLISTTSQHSSSPSPSSSSSQSSYRPSSSKSISKRNRSISEDSYSSVLTEKCNPNNPIQIIEGVLTSTSSNRPSNQIDSKNKKRYQCTWTGCTKTYAKPIRLKEHERSHTNEVRKSFCSYFDYPESVLSNWLHEFR